MSDASENSLLPVVESLWAEVLGREIGVDDDFFAAGGTSVQAAMITNRLQEQLGATIHPAAVFEAPTIRRLVEYVGVHYGSTVFAARQDVPEAMTDGELEVARARLPRGHVSPSLGQPPASLGLRRPLFILSPPRSGSTLLRVMLAGHPGLFSPPELYLLSFNDLRERRELLPASLGEGLVRAVMEARDQSSGEARALLDAMATEGRSTVDLYALIQSWIGARHLVDKTTAYSISPAVLRRARGAFPGARFIHLVRHPVASALSFSEVRADLLMPTGPREGSPLREGELWWTLSHENIRAFLATAPAKEQLRVHYEELVRSPSTVAASICRLMEIDTSEEMLRPYEERSGRMTDGVAPGSRMTGDPNFHRYKTIDAANAERWRERVERDFLADRTWHLAESLGYPRERFGAEEREVWEF